jgi:DNA-directed RNA polymerase specialized sigma24 family protein
MERRKFENEWVKLREQYRAAGFSDEGIDAMYAFDEKAYRSARRFAEHTQDLPSEDIGEDDDDNRSTLFGKFGNLAVTFDESDFDGRYAWVDTVSDPDLASRLKLLKDSDLELLTLFAIEGYSQTEIARIQGCSQKVVSVKITRIKTFLKNS